MDRVLIGDEGDQFVSLVVLRHDSHDAWDGEEWLLVQVAVRAGRWTGRFKACLRRHELVIFGRRLKMICEVPGRTAKCGRLENWLQLCLTRDVAGKVVVQGAAIDECGTGGLLKFNFVIDQAGLPSIIRQLSAFEQIRSQPGM